MAIINTNDMEISIRGKEKKAIYELIKDRLFCLIKMPAKKTEKISSKYSSSIFASFMKSMSRTFAIRDIGLKTLYEECEYYLSVYYKRGTDAESKEIFERNMNKIIVYSTSAIYPTEEELVSFLNDKELVLITTEMRYGNFEAFKIKDFLDNVWFLRKNDVSDFIRRDEICEVRVYLSRANNEVDVAEHRLGLKNICELDIGRRIADIFRKKSEYFYKFFGNKYYSMEFMSQAKDIQAMYFVTRFHSNEAWEADPINIVTARITAFILPGTISCVEDDKHLTKKKITKGINGEKFIIDAIHFNSDIFYDLAEFAKYLGIYFSYFGFD